MFTFCSYFLFLNQRSPLRFIKTNLLPLIKEYFKILLFCLIIILFPVEFIKMDKKGKIMAMLNSYTYFRHYRVKSGVRWQCTRHFSQNCSAFLVVNDQGKVVKGNDQHTHAPFKYYKNNSGIYTRY